MKERKMQEEKLIYNIKERKMQEEKSRKILHTGREEKENKTAQIFNK